MLQCTWPSLKRRQHSGQSEQHGCCDICARQALSVTTLRVHITCTSDGPNHAASRSRRPRDSSIFKCSWTLPDDIIQTQTAADCCSVIFPWSALRKLRIRSHQRSWWGAALVALGILCPRAFDAMREVQILSRALIPAMQSVVLPLPTAYSKPLSGRPSTS